MNKTIYAAVAAGIILVGGLWVFTQTPAEKTEFPNLQPEPTITDSLTEPAQDVIESSELSPTVQPTTMPDITELKIEDLKVGDGEIAETGDTVTMHYTGWLTNGTKFDSSLDRGQPFTTKIGTGQVIEGWDKGVPGMKVGGTRKLYIPSEMAYGERGAGGVIPPNADLVFEVELLEVVKK